MSTYTLMPVSVWELGVARDAGFTISQFRFAVAFFLSVGVGAILRKIPTVRARHVFSIVTGFLLIYYPFGDGCLHAFATSMLVYACMLIDRRRCGTLAWLVTFPYLVTLHIMQASGASWKEGHLDFTGALMVLTLKLIATAVCYEDGGKPVEKLREYSAAKRLRALPTPLEFASYCFAAGNLLAGPFFEATDYFDYVRREGAWDESDPAKRIPNPLLPGLLRFAKGIACALVWTKLSSRFSAGLMESAWFFQETSLVQRLGVIWAIGVVSRFKYYFAWSIAESSLIFSGFCFNGRDAQGAPLWNRYVNSRIRRVELNPSLGNLAANWNVATGLWLRHYVYERITPLGKRPTFVTLLVTQLVSALWHGIFPGYWLCFGSSAVVFHAGKMLYKYEQGWPASVRDFPLWVLAKVVFTALVLNYTVSSFFVLWLDESLAIWSSCYYLGHITTAAIVLASVVMPPRGPRLREKAVSANAAVGAVAVAAGAAATAAGETAAGRSDDVVAATATTKVISEEQKKEL